METWQEVRLKKIAGIVAKHCIDKEKVLDVGCFNGHIRGFLPEEVNKRINYTGLDIRGECDVKCDLNEGKLPFKDKEFDFVICTEIFEHILKPKDLLKEMKRVMKDQGHGVISIPNENHIILRLRHLFNLPYSGFVFDQDPQKHIHSPRLKEAISFVSLEFKILNKKYYTPKLKLLFLAKLWPSMFARGTIFEIEKA